MQSKVCTKCKKKKPLSEFYKAKNTKDGLRYVCKPCQLETNRKYYPNRNKKQHILNNRKSVLKTRFGLTLEQYDKMFEQQDGRCAICNGIEVVTYKRVLKRLCVDHSHKTGKVRKLLCDRCNRALGVVDDNIDLLKGLIKYLKEAR